MQVLLELATGRRAWDEKRLLVNIGTGLDFGLIDGQSLQLKTLFPF
jgi:hypothetical protein